LDPENIKSWVWWLSGTLTKEYGSTELISDYGARGARL
jgi:hypothetical protein